MRCLGHIRAWLAAQCPAVFELVDQGHSATGSTGLEVTSVSNLTCPPVVSQVAATGFPGGWENYLHSTYDPGRPFFRPQRETKKDKVRGGHNNRNVPHTQSIPERRRG